MRLRALRLTCTATFVAAGALMAVAAPSGAQEVTAAECGSKTYRWLFWPEGHGDLTSVSHLATDVPHLDVYSGKGRKFADTQNVAATRTAPWSRPTRPAPRRSRPVAGARTSSTSQLKQLVCTFTANPVFIAVPPSTVDEPSLSALVNGAVKVTRTRDSWSRFDPRLRRQVLQAREGPQVGQPCGDHADVPKAVSVP